MLLKATAIGFALVSTPIIATPILTAPQNKPSAPTDSEGNAATQRDSSAPVPVRLRDGLGSPSTTDKTEVEQLRAEVEALRKQVQSAKEQRQNLKGQLDEALDMIVDSTKVVRHRHSCTPSRSRSLLTHYQWMEQRGHEKRADKLIAQVIKNHKDDPGRMNSLAWNLMTEKGLAGKFNRAALRIAERMQEHRKLQHHYLDTIALAHFLNGNVKIAVENQRKALSANKSGDYRRRLMVYEAALRNGLKKADSKPVVEVVAGGD